jgi:YD repeat-containing protein
VVTDPFIFWRDGGSANTFRYVRRSGFTFDTSAIPDTDSINSATFTLVGTDKADPSGNTPNINVYTFAPADAANFVAGDFDSYGSTALSTSITYSGWSTTGANDFALNGTGLAEISKTGVTKLGVRNANHDVAASAPTYGGSGSDTSLVGDWADEGAGTTNDPKLVVGHTTGVNSAPIAPTSLLVEGASNPTNISDNTPEFSAIYNDPNGDDSVTSYRIQVSTSSSFTSVYWDSSTTSMATTTEGSRSPDLSYAGSALASSTLYYWRIDAFSDDAGATGIFSTTTSSFTLSPSAAIQAITLSYDANGNILSITESANTDAWRSVTYTYDSLNRLTSATTTVASTSPYRHQFGYNMLGNITKWYVDIGASFTAVFFTGGGGIRVNNDGVVGYYAGGAGVGLFAGGGIQFTSGDINVRAPEFTVADDITFGAGPSITTSYEGKFNPNDPLRVGGDGTRTFGIAAGLGGRVNKIYTQTIPIKSFKQNTCADCNLQSPNRSPSVGGISSPVPALQSGSASSQDVWATLRAAINQYYAEGRK